MFFSVELGGVDTRAIAGGFVIGCCLVTASLHVGDALIGEGN